MTYQNNATQTFSSYETGWLRFYQRWFGASCPDPSMGPRTPSGGPRSPTTTTGWPQASIPGAGPLTVIMHPISPFWTCADMSTGVGKVCGCKMYTMITYRSGFDFLPKYLNRDPTKPFFSMIVSFYNDDVHDDVLLDHNIIITQPSCKHF